jgi:hypothetical protein
MIEPSGTRFRSLATTRGKPSFGLGLKKFLM